MITNNPHRASVELRLDDRRIALVPSFEAILRWEDEAGSLLKLAERAASGDVRLDDVATALRSCTDEVLPPHDLDLLLQRQGLAGLIEPFKILLGAALSGRPPGKPQPAD